MATAVLEFVLYFFSIPLWFTIKLYLDGGCRIQGRKGGHGANNALFMVGFVDGVILMYQPSSQI